MLSKKQLLQWIPIKEELSQKLPDQLTKVEDTLLCTANCFLALHENKKRRAEAFAAVDEKALEKEEAHLNEKKDMLNSIYQA